MEATIAPRPEQGVDMVECPICPTEAEHQIEWDAGHHIYDCPSCNLLFAHPMPTQDDLNAYYQGFSYREPKENKIPAETRKHRDRLLRHAPEVGSGLRFLDHGGGTGMATLAAASMNWECHYYDLDRAAHDFVVRHSGDIKVSFHDEEKTLPTNYFDYVWSDNVIEHLPDPKHYIDRLLKLLRPGGRLVIRTPNAKNIDLYFHPRISLFGYSRRALEFTNSPTAAAKLYSKRIWCCDPPRHLFSFSDQSLLEAAGERPGFTRQTFTYRHSIVEYLLLRQVLSKPRPIKLDWWFRAMVAALEIAAKPLQRSIQILKPSTQAGVGIVITKD